MDRLWSEGHEDGRLCQGSCKAKEILSTQRIDFGLRAMKIDDYAKGHARLKKVLSIQWAATLRVVARESPSTQRTSSNPRAVKTDG